MSKFIPYSRQKIDQKDIQSVKKVLVSDFLTKGPVTEKFENKVSNFLNVKYSISIINASSALILACKALDIKKNDIVWTSANTYVSSINCALHCGAKIDLVDISLDDYNIDVSLLEKKLIQAKNKNKLPKIIILVHLAGYPNELDRINSLSKKYKFMIVEDASHAFGSKYKNSKIGNCKYSEMTIFSFHPVKTITSAEGGIITTNNKKYYDKILELRENGIVRKKNSLRKDPNFYDVKSLGYNFRINEINSSLGISQVKKINSFINQKNKIAKYYFKNLKDDKIILPNYKKNRLMSWHLFIIRFNLNLVKKKKETIVRLLKKKNILVNTHYIPLHYFSYIKDKILTKSFKKAEEYYDQSISIPIYPGLTKKNQDYVIKLIKNYIG